VNQEILIDHYQHEHSGKLINCIITSPFVKYFKGEIFRLSNETKIPRKEIINYTKLVYFDTNLNLFENKIYKGTKTKFSIMGSNFDGIEFLSGIKFNENEFNKIVNNFTLSMCR